MRRVWGPHRMEHRATASSARRVARSKRTGPLNHRTRGDRRARAREPALYGRTLVAGSRSAPPKSLAAFVNEAPPPTTWVLTEIALSGETATTTHEHDDPTAKSAHIKHRCRAGPQCADGQCFAPRATPHHDGRARRG